MNQKCEFCSKSFPHKPGKKFCNKKCRKDNWNYTAKLRSAGKA